MNWCSFLTTKNPNVNPVVTLDGKVSGSPNSLGCFVLIHVADAVIFHWISDVKWLWPTGGMTPKKLKGITKIIRTHTLPSIRAVQNDQQQFHFHFQYLPSWWSNVPQHYYCTIKIGLLNNSSAFSMHITAVNYASQKSPNSVYCFYWLIVFNIVCLLIIGDN